VTNQRGGWWLVCALAAVLFACAGKKRPFSDEPYIAEGSGGAGSSTSDGETVGQLPGGGEGLSDDEADVATGVALAPAARAVLGAACARDQECASGFCVDGVCCDGRCGELCATCAAPGSEGACGPSSSDPSCGALTCAGGTECRGYDQTQLEQNCEAIGQCRAGVECAPLDHPAGTACQAGTGTCDGLGQCVVPGKALLGAACTQDIDCGEGHCVAAADGTSICCDSACDGICQQCSAAGRCVEAPATDERCGAVDCPDDNVCRDYPDALTEDLCRGFGQCRTALDCPASTLRVESACECSTDGSCSLARGQLCAGDGDCGLAACAPSIAGENICCTVACAGGLSCSSDGSRCVECEGSSIRCDGNVELRCNDEVLARQSCENGCTPEVGCNDQAPVGFTCSSAECQAGASCQADVTGVRRCCSRDCGAEGKVCAENGSCVCPEGVSQGTDSNCLLQLGEPCGTGTAQCEAGLACVDGVCCSETCGGACESCNVPGNVGRCTFNAQDTNLCTVGEQCVNRGQCRLRIGQACAATDTRCVSNNCEQQLGSGGSTVCCGETCAAPRPFCSRDGNRCVECESNADCRNGCQNGVCAPLRPLGELCDVSSQCASNICTRIDGTNTSRCCGQCQGGQVCNSTGGCQCPPNQVLVNGQCRKVAGQTCQSAVECQTANCEASVDGANRCCAADCGDPNIRRCAQNGASCIDQRGGIGASCDVGSDCQSGNCVDGLCCDGPCGNVCERCNAPGQAGRCSAETPGAACNGGLACFGRNLCLPDVGQPCSITTGCGDGVCIPSALRQGDEICCALNCSDARPYCTANGQGCVECIADADCATGCNEQTGECNSLLANGVECSTTNPDQCSSGSCVLHCLDNDDDEFAVAGAVTETFCAASGFDMPGYTTRQPGPLNATDCQEGNANVFPGQTREFTTPAVGKTTRPFDYNCDDQQLSASAGQNRLQDCGNAALGACEARGGWTPSLPGCGQEQFIAGCHIQLPAGDCQSNIGGLVTRPCR
jgi:hypothetical protein